MMQFSFNGEVISIEIRSLKRTFLHQTCNLNILQKPCGPT